MLPVLSLYNGKPEDIALADLEMLAETRDTLFDNMLSLYGALTGAKEHRVKEMVQMRDKLDKLSTDDLLARLQQAGVSVTVESFVDRAQHHVSSLDLSEEWDGEEWELGVFAAAADVLWERLCPERFRFEAFYRRMLDGYEPIESGVRYDEREVCEHWWQAWEMLREFCVAQGFRDPEAVAEKWRRHIIQHPLNWANEFLIELHNAGVTNKHWAQRLFDFTQQFLDTFPDVDGETVRDFRRYQGESLFLLDRPAEGDAVFEELAAEQPGDAWTYAVWGDQYVPSMYRRAHENVAKAREIFERGLRRVKLDREALEERLVDLQRLAARD
ncbi:MAG: hypothetical protein K6T81_11045 [Alicyclobacillus macrosporangiidus]|uniref:hypothetical protein n=1 Tax=Alicyclobacillus macrosporangiidus TaxID=392015 RepID=UPI0026EF6C94|nr:hypothetical protein [Alicyclobacillus macrosporangiidus]MCL6599262.1 hypothetical protein [Alicyclobacillus macrosporangiidus]